MPAELEEKTVEPAAYSTGPIDLSFHERADEFAIIDSSRFESAKDQAMLASWAVLDRIGAYKALSSRLDRVEEAVRSSADESLQSAFAAYAERARAAVEYEEHNGAGSLRRLDDPWWAEVREAWLTYKEWKWQAETGWGSRISALTDQE